MRNDNRGGKQHKWLAAVPLIATLAAPTLPIIMTYHRHEQMQQPYLPILLHDETPYFPTDSISTTSIIVSGAGLYPNTAANGA